jgi:RNA polymerase sigma-70 factor (ECF subfamily)
MNGDDTELLIERARAGDRQAFDALAARSRAHLESIVRPRLGRQLQGRTGPEDVLQETYLRAWRSIRRFQPRGEGSFLRWLSGIAVRVILEAASRDGDVSLEVDFPSRDPSPSKALQREERFARLEEALETLSSEYRQVLTLVRLEGCSIAETAKRMQRSPNATSKLLLRALRKLRERFGDTESLGLPQRPLQAEEDRRGDEKRDQESDGRDPDDR